MSESASTTTASIQAPVKTQATDLSLHEFIENWGDALAAKVLEVIQPLYNPLDCTSTELFACALDQINGHRGLQGLDPLLPAQKEIIRAIGKAFYHVKKKSTFLVGEMGTGKTLMASAVAFAAPSPLRVLVQAPPHIVPKWCAELQQSLPGVSVSNISGRDALSRLQAIASHSGQTAERPEFYVISRERAKNSYFWREAHLCRRVDHGKSNLIAGESQQSGKEEFVYLHCPACGSRIIQRDEDSKDSVFPMSATQLAKKKQFCKAIVGYRIFRNCANEDPVLRYKRVPLSYRLRENEKREPIECACPLWTATPRIRRYSPAEFIKRHMKNVFDLFICDEVHEQKAGNSIQGNAFGALAASCKQTLALTGTLNGGYADELFHLLWRLTASRLKEEGFAHGKEQDWMDMYGVLQVIRYLDEEDTRSGKGKKDDKIIRRAPGVSPVAIARHLLDKCCFIRLSEISQMLPPFSEEVITISMNEKQQAAYKNLEQNLSDATDPYSETGAQLMSKTLQVLLAYPDSCVLYSERITVRDEAGKESVVAEAPQLSPEVTLPKEQEMLNIVLAEKKLGRRSIVFAVNTHKRDILERIEQKLTAEGIRVAVLRATVTPEKRMAWIEKKVEEGIDTIVTSPELVKTGLDLLDFPTFVYMQTGYSIFTLRQSSRRSWRLGQKRLVKVFYLCYKRTIQEEALRLIATKLHTSLMVEGELTEGGLTELSSSASNSILQDLAKSLREGMTGSAQEAWKKLRLTENLHPQPIDRVPLQASSESQPQQQSGFLFDGQPKDMPTPPAAEIDTVVRVRITRIASKGKGRAGKQHSEEREVDPSVLANIINQTNDPGTNTSVQFLLF